MGEHSVMDGTPTLTFMDSICTALADPALDHGLPAASSSTLEELQRTLNSLHMQRQMRQSISHRRR
jgi:hypothetical protein